jgi:hypothetical protein
MHMEQKLQQAESSVEPFALRQHVMTLSVHRQEFSKEIEVRFQFLCLRLREKMRFLMPSC